jgi:hypothetical protein
MIAQQPRAEPCLTLLILNLCTVDVMGSTATSYMDTRRLCTESKFRMWSMLTGVQDGFRVCYQATNALVAYPYSARTAQYRYMSMLGTVQITGSVRPVQACQPACRRWVQLPSNRYRTIRIKAGSGSNKESISDAFCIRHASMEDCKQLSGVELLCGPQGGAGWSLQQLQVGTSHIHNVVCIHLQI